MTNELPVITSADMADLFGKLRPGATYPATVMWTEYVRLMEGTGRPLATRNALGRALSAAGAQRKRVRRRANGKAIEVAAWTLPGWVTQDEDRQRMRTVMADLGEGEHPEPTILERYAEIGRRERWRGMLNDIGLITLMTKMGYVRTSHRGVKFRIVCAFREDHGALHRQNES